MQVFEDLEEVRLGDWGNGAFRRRAASGDPEFIAWSKTGRWDGIPGAETGDQLRSRVSAVINELARRHCGQCIAVVAHGGAINAYVAALFGIHRTIAFAVENTSITVAHVAPTSAMLGVVNDCSTSTIRSSGLDLTRSRHDHNGALRAVGLALLTGLSLLLATLRPDVSDGEEYA